MIIYGTDPDNIITIQPNITTIYPSLLFKFMSKFRFHIVKKAPTDKTIIPDTIKLSVIPSLYI